MRKNFVAGGMVSALIAAMLAASPAMAEEAPPALDESAVTMVSEVATDPDPASGILEDNAPATGDSNAPPAVGDAATDTNPTQDPVEPSGGAEAPAGGESGEVPPADKQTPGETGEPAEKPTPGKTADAPAPKHVPQAPAPAPATTTPAPAPKAPAEKTPTPAPAVVPKPATPSTLPAPTPSRPAAKTAIPVTGAIATRWNSLKGAASALGAPTAAAKTTGNYVSQQFSGGIIFATKNNGVQHILKSSKIGKVWFAMGEAGYGFPVSAEIATAQGTYQKFSKGHWIFTNGQPILTTGGVGKGWTASGGLNIMGAPQSRETCGLPNKGCSQTFKKGVVYWTAKTGGKAVWGGILGRYKAHGASANYIGYPTSKEMCTLVKKGCYQNFERGQILWSSATGAYIIHNGGIRNYYNGKSGAKGFLGFPIVNETCDKLGCSQRFQGGTIFWSSTTGAQAVKLGKLYRGYMDRGSYSGSLGFPTGFEVCGTLPKSGCYQNFKNGRLYSNTGQSFAYKTAGGIGAAYYAKGGPNSSLGYPLADEKCSGGQCAQTFQGGAIGWGPGAHGTYGKSECQNLNDGRSRYSTGGSKHVLLTFTETYRQSYATNVYCKNIAGVYVTEWRTDGFVGASGFKRPGEASGPTRNLYSPTGAFTVTEAFGLGNPGTALSYRTLNPNSRWGGNPWTPTYNKYHESSRWEGWDENMWYFATRSTRDYEQGAVINYNRPDNIVQDAGFAIFLHQNKVPTAGCISIDNWAMVDYLRKSVPGDRIIMGVRSAIFR